MDSAVIDEIKALLAADELDAPELEIKLISGEIGAPVDAEPATGQTFGPWRLLRPIGRGGMGEVYLAERWDGAYEQQVALKLLKRGMDTDSVLQRFLRERRILASLNHPNIARLLDAGAAADGRPYLVMEYVQGHPVTKWSREHRPTLRQILELMVGVCEAVHAAHRQQVVHRDLKPSNILVGEDGAAKLLDFGVAKLVSDEEAEATLTSLGSAPLTPQYAAPEQLLGQPVTPATDVYALGVLLYELLTGQLPRGHENARAATWAVLDGPPPTRPSAALRKDHKFEVEAGRATDRTRAKELDGDLDQIVLKALNREPPRRYAAAAELADDLHRYLDGRPVLARPDSKWYAARKFVLRNRVPVSAAAAVTLSLVIGLTTALRQAHIAGVQAQLARAQALRAERVKDFVVSVFAEQDPFTRNTPVARTPQKILADAAGRLDQELGGEPDLHAELLGDLGGIRLDFGDLTGSETMLRRAVKERTAQHGENSLEAAVSLNQLAHVLCIQGRFAEAQQTAQRAQAILQSHPDADALEVARAESSLALAASNGKGAQLEVEHQLSDALRIFEKVRGQDDPETLHTLRILADTHDQSRQQDLAEAEVNELILRTRRRYSEQSAAMGEALLDQGIILAHADQTQAAVEVLARAAGIFRSQLGDRNVSLAQSLSWMAVGLRDLRRFQDSLAAYAQAERALPAGEIAILGDLLRGEGRVDLLLGRADEGERALRAAYEQRRKNLGEGNGFTWYTASEWGRGLAAQGRLAQAESVQREAMTRLAQIMGPAAYQNALVLQALADTLERQPSRRAEAEALRRQELQIVEFKYPKTQAQWANHALELAHNLAGADTAAANAEGLSLCEQIVADYRAVPPDSESLAEAQLEYAVFLDRAGRLDPARQQVAVSLEALGRTPNPDAAVLKRAEAMQHRLEKKAG